MPKERPYAFRKRLKELHARGIRDMNAVPSADELAITSEWDIAISAAAGEVLLYAAKDLQDYLLTSMEVSVRLLRIDDIQSAAAAGKQVIVLATQEQLGGGATGGATAAGGAAGIGGAAAVAAGAIGASDDAAAAGAIGATGGAAATELSVARSYRLQAGQERLVICGADERGAAQGSYYIERLMNLREAPFVACQELVRTPVFSPCMVHSGWGLDQYPDEHLAAIAHAGKDAILVFAKGVDETPHGYQDFNDLIERAARYGLDVYAYSYLVSREHPESPRAEDYYNQTYGRLFERCPGFKGVILVGESCEFPSKDPNTTGIHRLDWPAGQSKTKPSPGWWPCVDYPQWLHMLKKVIRQHSQDAEIVFWTYNWGWAPEEDRLRLIHALPEDITLMVTFEMFEQLPRGEVSAGCVDYTLSFVGPGQYFKSEAEVARQRGIRLYTMSNTGGLTWDFGVIPYEPFPHQWHKRHEALLDANERWGLSGLMESHHFGWWPSFISELAQNAYWTPRLPYEQVLANAARRDFGESGANAALEAWRYWSEAITHYMPSDEDQYGPFRIGPSYPLLFRKEVEIPAAAHAMFGNEIVVGMYAPEVKAWTSPGAVRYRTELRELTAMLELMEQGNAFMASAVQQAPEAKQEAARRMLGIGQFISASIRTTLHVKKWWKLKSRLLHEEDREQALRMLEEMAQIAAEEIANAEATIPLVEADSRLGWEPSMEYMTDAEHLRWKIAQVEAVVNSDLAEYRSSLEV